MYEFPSVVSFKPTNRSDPQLYVFVRGEDGDLHTCFFDLAEGSWRWKSLGAPEIRVRRRVNSPPAVVGVYADREGSADKANMTVLGGDAHLYNCEWSGHFNDSPSTWIDLNITGRIEAAWYPSATRTKTLREFGRHRDRAVIWAWMDDGFLWFYDRGVWRWLDRLQGNADVAGPAGAISQNVGTNGRHWAYVVGTDEELHLNELDENRNSEWESLGVPETGLKLGYFGRPAPLFDPTRNSHEPSAFVSAGGELWELEWSSGSPLWHRIGRPPSGTRVSSLSVVAYKHEDLEKPYVFCLGADKALYTATFRDPAKRDWFFHNFSTDPGLPLATTTGGFAFRFPAAIVHRHLGEMRLYVFAISVDDDLVVSFWNPTENAWQMDNLGRPETER